MKLRFRLNALALALCLAGMGTALAEDSATVQTTASPQATTTLSKGQTDIAMSLAKAQLAQYGITQPTSQQMNAALNGGAITVGAGKTVQLKGVLTQRAAGQGWGQIANGMGVKLGSVVSRAKSKHHAEDKMEDHHASHEEEDQQRGEHLTIAADGEHHKHKDSKQITHADEKAHHHARHSSKHITTAAGDSSGAFSREQGKHRSDSVSTAGGKAESGRHAHGKRYGAGIVTAAGGSYAAPHHSRHQSGQGAGIVTASSTGSSGAGQGHSDEGSKHGKSGK